MVKQRWRWEVWGNNLNVLHAMNDSMANNYVKEYVFVPELRYCEMT